MNGCRSSYPFGQPFLLREDRPSSLASLSPSALPLPSLVRDRGRSRTAGSFPGQLTGVAWGVRIRCLGDAGVLGIGAVETRRSVPVFALSGFGGFVVTGAVGGPDRGFSVLCATVCCLGSCVQLRDAVSSGCV
ncbi:hypothetical protein ACOSQ2_026691 [Xanthoceras sorbifolium]